MNVLPMGLGLKGYSGFSNRGAAMVIAGPDCEQWRQPTRKRGRVAKGRKFAQRRQKHLVDQVLGIRARNAGQQDSLDHRGKSSTEQTKSVTVSEPNGIDGGCFLRCSGSAQYRFRPTPPYAADEGNGHLHFQSAHD